MVTKIESKVKSFKDFLINIFAWLPLASLGALGSMYLYAHDYFKTDYSYEIMKVVAQIRQETVELSKVELPDSIMRNTIVIKARALQDSILVARMLISSINSDPINSDNTEIVASYNISEISKIQILHNLSVSINNELKEIIKSKNDASYYFDLVEYNKITNGEAVEQMNELLDEVKGAPSNTVQEKKEMGVKLLRDKRLLVYLSNKDKEWLLIFGFLNILQIDIKLNSINYEIT